MWIDKYEIHYAYGMTFTHSNTTSSKDFSYVGFASDYNKERFPELSLEPLQHTLTEINKALEILDGETYQNEETTKLKLKTLHPIPSILHFALHGKLDPSFPERSALIFESADGDHELTAAEIYDLELPSDLTILSACNSGAGKIELGEGIRSLTRSFIHAGSSSVVTSLWEASDASTSKILNSFLSYLKDGKRKSEALRLAKLDYINEASPTYQAPKYWAHLVWWGKRGRWWILDMLSM